MSSVSRVVKIRVRHDVTIVEYLANLDQIQQERVTLLALPLPIEGDDGSPARVLVLED